MLKKALLFEATIIVCMAVAPLPPPTVPAPELSTGDAAFCIQEDPPAPAVDTLPQAPPTPVPAPPPPPVVEMADLLFPVQGLDIQSVISVFGDPRGSSRLHKGIDVEAPKGTAVVAVADGTIERRREGGNGGRQLYLRDAAGRLYYYAHLDEWAVEENQVVRAGEVLATVGNTGNARSTLPHLHFEVMVGKGKRAVDPLQFWVRP